MTKTILNMARVKAQLQREIDAANGFQRNIDLALKMLRRISIGDDVDGLTKGISYNSQMLNLCLERARAVLEALGMVEEESMLDITQLQTIVEQL